MCVLFLLSRRAALWHCAHSGAVAFKVYDMDRDGYIMNGELFLVLKMMVGNNLKDSQLQQIVDKSAYSPLDLSATRIYPS